ncbi:MAG TPA: dTDP-glucose 4,6-dehydratase [bacterium]|uniref:dTDP-glucose 4,6-dehydratase n=1 Tax=candidate division TA06 bacterium ADurb.Bin417 TaxID=1852828 RepID=A0A1V5MFA3_UNCT6|nr:MAG: dTDP-glucose 4,6-dehydratase [candidate division TA06 bacterium ADurb.Bin417]HNQ35465.1 dTDP-glucose 4,6-dehydratase [bacterium]HNS48338.1 dTDP-glucose 4,6-dehydratase [bacterium]
MKLLVTGGCGFIGSNFILHVLRSHPGDRVVNLDKLTYAGNPANLAEIKGDPGYEFVRGDICDARLAAEVLAGCDAVVNFAAESHVDRSIREPDPFLLTNFIGTGVLLEAARRLKIPRFLHISTDEVYGPMDSGQADESAPLHPSSPYSASKAAADHLCLAYHATYRLPVLVTRSSNNYGPRQYPEKLVPLCILRALAGGELPLYGDGQNRRDWLYVEDNCRAIDLLLRQGREGEIYNIAGGRELSNLEVAGRILELAGRPPARVTFVADRPGHDRRYGINWEKLKGMGWRPEVSFEEGLARTLDWFRKNPGREARRPNGK